jgi:hypothetical protein
MSNPQANAIIKCAHQTLGNLIRSFQLQDKPYYDLDDPWGGILTVIKERKQQIICKNNRIKNSK